MGYKEKNYNYKKIYITKNLLMKPKVLFLIESLSGGGAEKVLTTLLQNINYNQFDITLCTICNIGKYLNEINPKTNYISILPDPKRLTGISKIIYQIKYKLIYNLLPLKWVYKWFIPHHTDVEIAFVEGFATKLLAHSSNKKAKKIAWVHCDMQQFHWTKSIYNNIAEEEKTYRKCHQIITVSQTAQQSFKNEFKNVTTPIKTLYNPINSLEIIEKSKEIKNIPRKTSDTIRIVSVGRFTAPKAYDRLLRIINRLIIEKYPIELWLLGDGEQRTLLEDYIKKQHLEKAVTLWGFQDNPYSYLSHCDIFICSSISEGYSTAITEALILGLAIITTDCSGMNELLKNGECGIITENSEEALYNGIKQLLNNPELIKSYKEKAIERGKNFSLEKLIKPIEMLFK